ncbi:High-affinity branched-chain amino acid transport ATP-binding protein LivF [subsurface metagenome]
MEKYSQEALLKVNNIDVFHGSFQALWDVSLEVKPGEMLALIGANTSGKSTLLDTISGLLHPAKGSIEFEGRDTSAMTPFQIVELGISQVPEGRRLFPEMSVLDNLTIGSYNRKARPKKEENFKKVYTHFPILGERKNQLAKTLSGGEQQMLAIGRGLMADPKLMLLDEMSLGLAPIILDELYRALREIKERGITILFVEQNVRRTLQEADRAYILESGRVVLSGTPAELQEEEKVRKAYFGV